MKKTIHNNKYYMISLFIFYFIIPHLVMSLPHFSELDPAAWTGEKGFWLPRIYLIGVWIGVPLSGAVIALLHVLRNKEFCPVLTIEAALLVSTYFLRIEATHAFTLLLSVLLILLIDSFTLLSPHSGSPQKKATLKFWKGLAENRKFLVLVCFWSVGIISIIQISGSYLAEWNEFVLPMILVPLALVLLVLPAFRENPLTMGGYAITLILYILSAFLCTTFYMERYWIANVVIITVGYILLLVMETLLHGGDGK